MFVCGYSYDDYDYGEVNQLLERDLKLYIKAVACFPDATKTSLCPLSWAPLKTSERVRGLFPLILKVEVPHFGKYLFYSGEF